MLDGTPGVNLSELKIVEKQIFHSTAEYTHVNPMRRKKQPSQVCMNASYWIIYVKVDTVGDAFFTYWSFTRAAVWPDCSLDCHVLTSGEEIKKKNKGLIRGGIRYTDGDNL